MIQKLLVWSALVCVSSVSIAQDDFPTFEPTEEHKLLAKDVGVWEATMKMYLEGPDAKPTEMPARETVSLMQGGLWVVSDYESGPFKGHSQMGYDPIKKKVVGTWIDNSTPFLSTIEGTFDKKTGVLTTFMTGIDPMTEKPQKMKSISKLVDENTRHFKMYTQESESDKWVLTFEILYHRAK